MPFNKNITRFNKRILNPMMLKFTGASANSFATIEHVGRKSGKTFRTPIMVHPTEGGFIFALTYGPNVDWYRNVSAAGQCNLYWHGQHFVLGKPEPRSVDSAIQIFPRFQRFVLQTLNRIQDFVFMPDITAETAIHEFSSEER